MSALQAHLRAVDALQAITTTPLSRARINTAMDAAYAGQKWQWRAAYDAIEGAIAQRFLADGPSALVDGPASFFDLALQLQRWAPTQTIRSVQSQRRELFSTPPRVAVALSLLLQPRPRSRVLEPSAGNGGLAAPLSAFGTHLVLNELDVQASTSLKRLFPESQVFNTDAIIIDAATRKLAPIDHAALNPPFAHAESHLASAFACLRPGGSLAAILPARFRDVLLARRLLGDSAVLTHHFTLAPKLFAHAGVSTETVLVRIERDGSDRVPQTGHVADLAALRALAVGLKPVEPPPAERVDRSPTRIAPQPRPASRVPKLSAIRPPLPGTPIDYSIIDHREPQSSGQSPIYARYNASRLALSAAMPHSAPLVETLSLASVALPGPVYRPHLPKRLVTQGVLSEPQLEAITYAGQAHQRHIPGFYTPSDDGTDLLSRENGEAYRYGFFLADGTGVGKGRTVAGIVMDNLCQGRRKALWISESAALIEDARRDWCDLGGRPHHIVDLKGIDANADRSRRQARRRTSIPCSLSSPISPPPHSRRACKEHTA